jgi:ABC-2 type transport system permease protein
MSAALRSELLKLRRRGMLFAAGLVAASVSLAVGFLIARAGESAASTNRLGSDELTEQILAQADGFARALALASELVGAVILAIFAYSLAAEFSQATIRNLLVREPRRLRLLGGKLLALVAYTSVAVAGASLVAWAVAMGVAEANGIDSSAWLRVDGLVETAEAAGRLLAAAIGWGLLGAVLGLLLRSPTTAVAVGLAYALPLENLLSSVWSVGAEWLPGQLLESVAEGGGADVSLTHAAVLLSIYAAAALALAAAAFARRDVTD